MYSQTQDLYQQNIAIIIISLNVISMICLFAVLLIYVVNWKSIASFPVRLSFYLCISCLGQNITVLLLNPITLHEIQVQNKSAGELEVSSFCVFDGILKVTFDLSSIIWTTLIIYSVYVSIVTKIKLQKMEIPYILIAFLFPIAAACIPIFFNAYEFDTYSCWFKSDYIPIGFWLRMIFFFIPLWVLFIINMTLTGLTYKELKRLQLPAQIMHVFKRLILFPFIIFVCGTFATIDLFYTFVNQKTLIWLDYVSLFFLNMYGIFNSIAYGLNPIIRQRIVMCFRKDSYRVSNSSDISNLLENRSSRNSSVIQAELLQLATIKKGMSVQNSRLSQQKSQI